MCRQSMQMKLMAPSTLCRVISEQARARNAVNSFGSIVVKPKAQAAARVYRNQWDYFRANL
jgi:hypothetical protein